MMARINESFYNVSPVVDEQTKIAKAREDAAAQAAATPAVDVRAALAKLTGGQALTDAEKIALGMAPTPVTPVGPVGPTLPATPTPTLTATKPVNPVGPTNPAGRTFSFTDPKTGRTYTFNSEAELNAFMVSWQQGVKDANATAAAEAAAKLEEEKARLGRQSAYDLLLQQFSQYGLASLVEPLKELITSNISPSEFALRLQNTDAYKKRFAANQERINKGLRALTPAEYVGLEDQYQNIMRNYGLPASYYTKDSMGTQQGFEKFLSNDVSAAELEDRIATAQKRVINTNPEVLQALKQFYPDLNNSDILAYTLDPSRALEEIKRKVTAAEIGGAALAQGLQASGGTAESLAGYGITKAQAQQGYQTIGEFLPTAQKLGDIYAEQGLGSYDQATAEKEVFGTQGAATAAQKRRKLAQLEQATFGGQAGTAQGAFDRGRQGAF